MKNEYVKIHCWVNMIKEEKWLCLFMDEHRQDNMKWVLSK